MAIVAIVPAGDVVLSLARCGASIVAARAGTDDREVIDLVGRFPAGRGMAVLAEVRGVDMGYRFFRS